MRERNPHFYPEDRFYFDTDAVFRILRNRDFGFVHQILTFTEANHAFFNDTGMRFNAPAAEEAWRRTIGWFDRYLRPDRDKR